MIKADKESNLPSFLRVLATPYPKASLLVPLSSTKQISLSNSSKETKCLMRLVISSSLDPPLGMPTMSKEISCILSKFLISLAA